MANLNNYIPQLFKWEGNYAEDSADLGGPTNMGVTLKTWLMAGYDKDKNGVIDKNDLKMITKNDVVEKILKPYYWNRWQADRIQSQALANILVDWVWCSGKYGILIPQSVLKVKTDGIVGEETLSALNNYPNPEELFNRLKAERIAYIERICKARPANNRFKKGWLNRIASFRFFAIAILFIICFCWGGCKSIPQQKRMKTSTETVENTVKNIDSTSTKQQNQLTVSRMEQDSEKGSVTETIIINYDTSLPKDTATGNHPVRSISKTTTVKNLKVTASTDEIKQTDEQQTDRLTDKSKTTITRKAESLEEKQPGKDPYRWQYLTVAIVVVIIIFGSIYKFYHRYKE